MNVQLIKSSIKRLGKSIHFQKEIKKNRANHAKKKNSNFESASIWPILMYFEKPIIILHFDVTKSHIDIIRLNVDIILLACRGQK